MARAMKPSGIEWLGDIPAEWEIGRIGQLYSERREKVSDVDFSPLSVTMRGILPQLSSVAKSDAHDDRKLVRKGDFAINSRSDRRGSCGTSPFDGSVSLINIILTPREGIHPVYYDWLFHSTMFADEFYKWGHGIVDDLWTTNWQDMKKISVPVPPLDEQQRIAAFLDRECARIDSVVEKTRASIEEYRKLKQAIITRAVTKGIRPNRAMKDSGIDWLGDIPADWELSKIKYVADFQPSCDTSKLTDESEITYTPMECIKNGYFINNTTLYGSVAASLTPYNDGDIVVAKVTPCFENGNIAVMENLASGFGLGSSELFVLRPHSVATRYLFYWLQNDSFKQRCCATMTGTGGLKRVSPYFVRNSLVTSPPLDEQKEIAAYLDEKTAAIDSLVAKKNRLVSELESLKKSLIFEYVTGKKEVPK